jgi:hypothetical protein
MTGGKPSTIFSSAPSVLRSKNNKDPTKTFCGQAADVRIVAGCFAPATTRCGCTAGRSARSASQSADSAGTDFFSSSYFSLFFEDKSAFFLTISIKAFSKGFRGPAPFAAQWVKGIRCKIDPHIFMQLKIKKMFWDRCLQHHAAKVDRCFYAIAVACFVDNSPPYSIQVAVIDSGFLFQRNFFRMNAQGELRRGFPIKQPLPDYGSHRLWLFRFPIKTSPLSCLTKPAIMERIVVLPLPLGPSRTWDSPLLTCRSNRIGPR